MDIMTHLLERNNIDVPYFARKEGRGNFANLEEHCHTVQFKGNDCHDLVSRINYFSDVSYFYTHFYI